MFDRVLNTPLSISCISGLLFSLLFYDLTNRNLLRGSSSTNVSYFNGPRLPDLQISNFPEILSWKFSPQNIV